MSSKQINKTKKTPSSEIPRNLSIEESAQRSGVSTRYLRREIHDRKIAFVRIGRRVLIPSGALEQYLADRTVPPYKTGSIISL